MGTPWAKNGTVERDQNDNRADDAVAYFYVAGTSTPLAVYQDAAESTPHEHPVEADSGRWPAVHIPYTTYKIVIKSAVDGTTLFSDDNIANPEPFDETFTLDTTTVLNTGDIWFSLKNGTRSGAVRLNGRTIGDASSSATERANADCADLFAFLWNNVANGQAAVSTGRGATAAADFAAHKTIALPNAQGCGAVGFDDMGATAASLLGSAPVVSGSAILAGSILGANTHTLLEAHVPSHTHAFTATTGAGSAHTHGVSGNTGAEAAHTHTGTTNNESLPIQNTYQTATSKNGITGPTGANMIDVWHGADTGATSSTQLAFHTHTFTSAAGSSHLHAISLTSASESAHTHSVSGTTGNGSGSGTAHNILSRSMTVTWFIKL